MSNSLNITIIGAGLGGLACARVLREQHQVTLVEKSHGNHEVGAAINLGPTATGIMDALGFDHSKSRSIVGKAGKILDQNGNLLNETDMDQYRKNCQSDWLLQHRHDLWTEFKRLATAPSADLGIKGNPATVMWAKSATDVNVETGDVTLDDGTILHSDLVVGADGLKSIVRHLVVGDAAFDTARPSGSSAFRFTLTADEVKAAVGHMDIMDPSKPPSVDLYMPTSDSDRLMVAYPCRDFEILNMACIVSDKLLKTETTESWSASGSLTEMMPCFEDFSPSIKALLSSAKDIKLWQLRDQDPLPSYIKGRAVLIGDAAHAMTPHQGQGGTQSVEDAEGLSLFNFPSVDRDTVPNILHDFDRVRRTRASHIQQNTRDAYHHRSVDAPWKHTLYNWTYPGIKACLERLNAGEEMIVP